jgi:predicted phage tail protein
MAAIPVAVAQLFSSAEAALGRTDILVKTAATSIRILCVSWNGLRRAR